MRVVHPQYSVNHAYLMSKLAGFPYVMDFANVAVYYLDILGAYIHVKYGLAVKVCVSVTYCGQVYAFGGSSHVIPHINCIAISIICLLDRWMSISLVISWSVLEGLSKTT